MVRAMVFLGSVLYIVGLILTDISYSLGRSAGAAAMSACHDRARHPVDRCADLRAAGGGAGAGVVRSAARSICGRRGGASRSARWRWRRRWCWACSSSSACSIRCITASGCADSPADAPQYSVEVLSAVRCAGGRAAHAAGKNLLGAAGDAAVRQGDSIERDGAQCARLPAPAATAARIWRHADARLPDIARRTLRWRWRRAALAGLLLFGRAGGVGRRGARRCAWRRGWQPGQRVASTGRGGRSSASLALLLMLAGVIAQLAAGYHVLGTDKVGQDVLYSASRASAPGW